MPITVCGWRHVALIVAYIKYHLECGLQSQKFRLSKSMVKLLDLCSVSVLPSGEGCASMRLRVGKEVNWPDAGLSTRLVLMNRIILSPMEVWAR